MITSKLNTFAFPKKCRLNTPSEFSRVFSKPKKLYAKGLTVLYIENGLTYARLGMAIAKKHAKRAVIRNKVRRLIRESFREYAINIAGFDVVILANRLIKPDELNAWFEELTSKWQQIARQRKSLSQSLSAINML